MEKEAVNLKEQGGIHGRAWKGGRMRGGEITNYYNLNKRIKEEEDVHHRVCSLWAIVYIVGSLYTSQSGQCPCQGLRVVSSCRAVHHWFVVLHFFIVKSQQA